MNEDGDIHAYIINEWIGNYTWLWTNEDDYKDVIAWNFDDDNAFEMQVHVNHAYI